MSFYAHTSFNSNCRYSRVSVESSMRKSKSLSESDTEIYTQDYMLHIRKEKKLFKIRFCFSYQWPNSLRPPWQRSCNSPDEIFSKEQLRHLADTFGGGGSVAAKSFGKRPKLQRLCHRVLAVYNDTPTHTPTHKRGHLFLMMYINNPDLLDSVAEWC